MTTGQHDGADDDEDDDEDDKYEGEGDGGEDKEEDDDNDDGDVGDDNVITSAVEARERPRPSPSEFSPLDLLERNRRRNLQGRLTPGGNGEENGRDKH